MTDRRAAARQGRGAIRENPVLLFMKGMPDAPRCGFSMRVVQVLGVAGTSSTARSTCCRIWSRSARPPGEISDWRTFPQLYVNGELVGGADIVEEMLASGELAGTARRGAARGASSPRPKAAQNTPGAEPAASDRELTPRRDAAELDGRRLLGRRPRVTWKEEPHPQAATTFGLLTANPAPWRPST